MPDLPSGRRIALGPGLIVEPRTLCGPCPTNHFWFQTPDPAFNAPTFHPEQKIRCKLEHAEVPATLEELETYVAVLECSGGWNFYWAGLFLSESDWPDGWNREDCEAWRKWRQGEKCREYLRQIMAKCKEQAAANARATEPEEQAAVLAGVLAGLREVEEEMIASGKAGDGAAEPRCLNRLRRVLTVLEPMLETTRRADPDVLHAYGIACGLLGEHDLAEGAFGEVTTLRPMRSGAWRALYRARSDSGDLRGAAQAGRRALELEPDDVEVLRALATGLIQLGELSEAEGMIRRAIQLEPESEAICGHRIRSSQGASP